MTETLNLILSRLCEVPGEMLAPEPFGAFFRTLAEEMLLALNSAQEQKKRGEDRPKAVLFGHFQEEKLAAAESALPEGLYREILFALWQEEKGLWHRFIALDEERVAALVELFLGIYGAFLNEELPDPGALLQDYRSFVLDYLPEQALSYVRRELDLYEEAILPAAPTGLYQEHLLAEAAAIVGNWRVHLTNAKQMIIGKETALIAADPKTLPVAAYVRRMLKGLGVRSSVMVRPPELSLSAPWAAECGASVPHAQTANVEEPIVEEALLRLPASEERVLALFLDEGYVSRRLRAEEEALRSVGEAVCDGHVGTLRIVSEEAQEERPGDRYFSERQRELYRTLIREIAAIRKRYMKARPFVCTASVNR